MVELAQTRGRRLREAEAHWGAAEGGATHTGATGEGDRGTQESWGHSERAVVDRPKDGFVEDFKFLKFQFYLYMCVNNLFINMLRLFSLFIHKNWFFLINGRKLVRIDQCDYGFLN